MVIRRAQTRRPPDSSYEAKTVELRKGWYKQALYANCIVELAVKAN